jgi:MoxR-like ATPase
MITNFKLGEHLLLIGSQGTGKNKLTDQMLQILRLPREYIQLHRDTTVATLTSQPTVKDHVIVWEDSALVKAVKYGRVLVIDECDKAEREVTSVLKNLVDGEMLLADGRRIVSKAKLPFFASTSRDNIIEIHPSFRMIVLANRPGWPFHGNDFFKELGDLFAVATIDNPDQESEFELLSVRIVHYYE